MKSSDTKQNYNDVEKVIYKNSKRITKDSLERATENIIDKINSMDGDDKIIIYVIDTRNAEDSGLKSRLKDRYFHATGDLEIEYALDKIKDTIISEENYIQQTKTQEIKIIEYQND